LNHPVWVDVAAVVDDHPDHLVCLVYLVYLVYLVEVFLS
jgi:hypothetical protein